MSAPLRVVNSWIRPSATGASLLIQLPRGSVLLGRHFNRSTNPHRFAVPRQPLQPNITVPGAGVKAKSLRKMRKTVRGEQGVLVLFANRKVGAAPAKCTRNATSSDCARSEMSPGLMLSLKPEMAFPESLGNCHKGPARRYATASGLAADLKCFLQGRPIAARPVGPLERGLKWARRRPTQAALIAAVALVILSCALGGVFFGLYKGLKAEGLQQEINRHTVPLQPAARGVTSRRIIKRKNIDTCIHYGACRIIWRRKGNAVLIDCTRTCPCTINQPPAYCSSRGTLRTAKGVFPHPAIDVAIG